MNRELTILQVNDMHAYLDLHPELFFGPGGPNYRQAGGYARIATLVKGIRAEHPESTLFLDNGDTLHGTYPAVHTQGQALVPILNALGLDAMTVHWDGAYGPGALKRRASELNYLVLAANLWEKNSQDKPFPPYQLVERGGLRLGIIGLASNLLKAPFSPGFDSSMGLEELPKLIQTLRSAEQADLVLVLSHLGFPQDMQLASEVAGIDVLVSGHTHNRLYQPARVGQTLVIQSGSHGSFVGRLDLKVEDGRIVDFRHELLIVEQDIVPNDEVQALVQSALAPFRPELSEVVGETTQPLDRVGMLETSIDNLLLLALQESTGLPIAFSNGWRYGAPILPGKITLNDLYNIIPMDPPVSTVELSGEELVAMLEENLERTFSRNPYEQKGGYVKRALGIKVYFKAENPPGQRIQKVFVGNEALQPDRTYPAAFVTQQGVPEIYGQKRQKHSQTAIQAMRNTLSVHKALGGELHNTFVIV